MPTSVEPVKKKPLGRPPKIDALTLSKLEDAYKVGASDLEACFAAGISPATLYRWQEHNPEFIHRKMALKEAITFKARNRISKDLERPGSGDLAIKYLERKKKDEFSLRTEQVTDSVIEFRVVGVDGKPVLDLNAAIIEDKDVTEANSTEVEPT